MLGLTRKEVKTNIDGVGLYTCIDPHSKKRGAEMWRPLDWDGPDVEATLSEWPAIIAQWRVAKMTKPSFQVWDLRAYHANEWLKRDAVFRVSNERVLVRKYPDIPDSLEGIRRNECAPDTPEVEEAIKNVLKLRTTWLEASARYNEARTAITCLSEKDVLRLPLKEGF